jgi:hypothetical protein
MVGRRPWQIETIMRLSNCQPFPTTPSRSERSNRAPGRSWTSIPGLISSILPLIPSILPLISSMLGPISRIASTTRTILIQIRRPAAGSLPGSLHGSGSVPVSLRRGACRPRVVAGNGMSLQVSLRNVAGRCECRCQNGRVVQVSSQEKACRSRVVAETACRCKCRCQNVSVVEGVCVCFQQQTFCHLAPSALAGARSIRELQGKCGLRQCPVTSCPIRLPDQQ